LRYKIPLRVTALVLLVDHPAAVGQVFNVGNPEEISIGELAKLVKKLTGSHSQIRRIPYDEAYQPGFEDMHRRLPNIEKISRLVGFAPKIKLHEIVMRIIESKGQEFEQTAELPVTAGLQPHSLRAGAAE